MNIAILIISEQGLHVAQQLQKEWPQATLYSTHAFPECQRIASIPVFMETAFSTTDAFFFIGAMGICVRSIAPYIIHKHTDPAVICIDSTGKYAVSVLSGHVGKANELTKHAAQQLGAEPVITTQSDRTGLWALDTLNERYGWEIYIPQAKDTLNALIARFVNQQPTALLLEANDEGTAFLMENALPHVTVFRHIEDIEWSQFQLLLVVSPFHHDIPKAFPTLQYVPKVLHLGVGLARQAKPVEEIIEKIWAHLKAYHLLPKAIKSINTIDVKKDEPVIKALQTKYPVHFFTADTLNTVEVPSPSEVVCKHVGTPSVCEAAALLASGNTELIFPKIKDQSYTLAAAFDPAMTKKGHIEIVGAGPGDPDLISVRGRKMLEKADLILYAGSLVPRELTLCAKAGATVVSSASMNLEEQFELMKEFYDRAAFVVRLHTGDPCIYGAIEEQMNFFDRYKMSYNITPGISSFQAAAAALRSQFTIPEKVQTIILTRGEGRTPMPDKEKLHLLARSQSTMCIFLSAGIVDKVQEELLKEYPEETPVAACYHLTWKDQRIYRGELKNLAQIVKENGLTLTTMIVIGTSIDNRDGVSKLYDKHFKHLFRS